MNVRCLDLEYLEIKKTFKPKAKLKREFLHKIMCKSINRAIQNTNGLGRVVLKTGMTEVGLSFDFLSGWIEIVKIPNPPQPDEEMHELGGSSDLHQKNTSDCGAQNNLIFEKNLVERNELISPI